MPLVPVHLQSSHRVPHAARQPEGCKEQVNAERRPCTSAQRRGAARAHHSLRLLQANHQACPTSPLPSGLAALSAITAQHAAWLLALAVQCAASQASQKKPFLYAMITSWRTINGTIATVPGTVCSPAALQRTRRPIPMHDVRRQAVCPPKQCSCCCWARQLLRSWPPCTAAAAALILLMDTRVRVCSSPGE